MAGAFMASTIIASRAHTYPDRAFFGGAAIAMFVATVIGFAPTYYLTPFIAAPALDLTVHLHGAVFTAWMLLYCAQTGLITAGRRDIHRAAGGAGAALAVAVVVFGIVVAVHGARTGGGPPGRNQPLFLVFPLANIVMFAGLVTAGIVQRARSASHKRLMLLATLALVVTPLARISRMLHLPFSPPPVGGLLLSDIVVVALLVFDLRTRGRLHPITIWAGSIYLVSQPLRIMLGHSEAWQGFARTLIG